MRRQRLMRWLLAPGMLLVALLLAGARPARSQGPECPPGFEWKRLSGVGCVQVDCGDIAHAHYSYTQSCICEDGYKQCWEPVDYSGFDRTLCGPNCPNGRLVACVPVDSPCPGEEPAPPTAAPEPTARPAAPVAPAGPDDDESTAGIGDGDPLSLLSKALAGGDASAPTTGRAAAAGAAAAGGVGAILLVDFIMNLLSTAPKPATSASAAATAAPATSTPTGPTVDRIYDGDKAKKILEDAGILQDLRKIKRDDPNYWEKVDRALAKVKDQRRVKGIAYDQGPQGINEDGIVIVVEEPEQPLAPPPPPPAPPAPVQPAQPVPPVPPPQPAQPPAPKPPAPPKPPAETKPAPPPAPVPPPAGASATGSAFVSPTFDDATPQQQAEITVATGAALQQVNKAIGCLEAAKQAPDLLVGAYFDINGTSPGDQAKLDGLIARFEAMKERIERGVPYEVDTYGPVSFGWDTLKRGTIFARADGYVWRLRGYGAVGDVHIVGPRWSQLSANERASLVVHELSHHASDTADHAYSWEQQFWNLSQAQKLENADSLAEFAMGVA